MKTRHTWAPALAFWAIGLLPAAGWCEAVVAAEEREDLAAEDWQDLAAEEWPEHAGEEAAGEPAGAEALAPVDAGAGDDPPLGASEADAAFDPGAGDEEGALAVALPAGFDERRLDECAASPRPVLNEICAVGTECDEDVRVADFVEVYNPNAGAVDLGCFVLAGREGIPFVPQGMLEPGDVRAWGEGELRFRIRKGSDTVQLLRVVRGEEAPIALEPLESVVVDDDRAHLYRLPDGGSWLQKGVIDAEHERPGSFGERNATAPEATARP